MAYKRALRFEEGQTLFACSICGFPYLFPMEMVHGDDGLFYCTRTCWKGETVTGHNRRRAGWHPPPDNERPPVFGRKPSWSP